MVAWRPSRYNVLVPLRRGSRLAWNGLTGGLAVWDAEDVAVYEAIAASGDADRANPVAAALLQGGWLVRDDVDELAMLEREYLAHRHDYRTLTLTLAPTLACNFDCDYCFQGREKAAATMSEPVQDAVVGLVERVLPSLHRVHVAWYGGEPTLRMGVIEALSDRLIAACGARGVGYEAMIVTNGYRLDQATARSLHDRGVRTAQITIDGDQAQHDARRVLLSRRGTFARILANLRDVVDAVPLMLSLRVNIDERNADGVRRLLDHLAEVGLGGRRNLAVYFAPVEAITEGCRDVVDETLSKARYARVETELHRHAFELGLAPLPAPPRFRGTCAAVRPRGFVVVPNGDVHKCWDTVSWPDKAVGDVFHLDALNVDPRVHRWVGWSPFDNEACRSCKLVATCAGACAYKFLHADETRGEAAVLPCPSWKYNLHERLLLRAEKSGFLTADDYDAAEVATDPGALCADVAPGGRALPEPIQRMKEAMAAAL